MNTIKKRFACCLVGAVLSAGIAVYFACTSIWHAVVLFAAAALVLTGFATRAFGAYRSARLICDNPILNVGVASIQKDGFSPAEDAVNVVVSGFGILLDNKPYKFGHDGVKLTATAIDRKSIILSFGGEEKSYSVRLLHGIADKSDLDMLIERLRYETGVAASVSDW